MSWCSAIRRGSYLRGHLTGGWLAGGVWLRALGSSRGGAGPDLEIVGGPTARAQR
jgi:hypothetical protein